MGFIVLVRCVLVLRCGLAGVVWYPYAGWSTASACIKIPHHHTVTPTHIEPEQYNTWNNSTNKSQAPEDGCTNIRNMLSIKQWNNKASDIKLISIQPWKIILKWIFNKWNGKRRMLYGSEYELFGGFPWRRWFTFRLHKMRGLSSLSEGRALLRGVCLFVCMDKF